MEPKGPQQIHSAQSRKNQSDALILDAGIRYDDMAFFIEYNSGI
jgi:hypothetical protein